jgi:hypothetical protein
MSVPIVKKSEAGLEYNGESIDKTDITFMFAFMANMKVASKVDWPGVAASMGVRTTKGKSVIQIPLIV